MTTHDGDSLEWVWDTLDLGKWPRLLVVGDQISQEQAAEILVRTDDWYLLSNDRDFVAAICKAFGITTDKHWQPNGPELAEFRDSLNALDLPYLANNRIVSSWIGGPHGWVDWSGEVGCSTFNIGKWPGVEGIYYEWKSIAEEWPYLTLTSQLVTEEGEGSPAVQFDVADGHVTVTPRPAYQIVDAHSPPFASLFNSRDRERGCTVEYLIQAVDAVLNANFKED